jgi:hypothetical protein
MQACNITDHDLVFTTVPMRPAAAHPPRHNSTPPQVTPETATAASAQTQPAITYRWIEGTCLKEYGTSAVKWKKHTAAPEFAEKFFHSFYFFVY